MVERKEFWTTSDGKQFATKAEAEVYERNLKDPTYILTQRIDKLEAEIAKLTARLERVESPWGKINKPIFPQYPDTDCNPFQPYNGKVWYGTGNSIDEAINNLKEVKE